MALTQEDLQAIGALFDSKLENALQPIKADLDTMKADIADIKESLEEVRSTTNSLVAWADNVSVVTQIKFPVQKVNNG